tara:strand:+ start:28 stop:1572 length:1545 start_codon:yes stop_codon:yes gene_type:complete
MPNDVKLQSQNGTHPLDENLRPLKIGDKTAPLELSDTGVKVVGDLEITGNIDRLKSSTIANGSEEDITLTSGKDIVLNVGAGDDIQFQEEGLTFARLFDSHGAFLQLSDAPGAVGTFTIYVATGGATYIGAASLLFDISDDIEFQAGGASGSVAEALAYPIIFKPGSKLLIDKNKSHSTAVPDLKALHVDLDRTGPVYTGTDTSTGIDVDVNHTGASDAGNATINAYGIDIDVVGDVLTNGGSATSTAHGITLDISGSDTCNGIYVDNKDGGTDFKNVSSADATDYFTLNTIAAGNTTLTTVDTTVGATAHLNMVADGNFDVDAVGDITLDAEGGNISLLRAGSTYIPTASSDAVPLSHLPFVLYSQFQDDVGTSKHYLPLKGYFEQPFIGNEPAGMIAPFNMTLQKIVMRSSEDISGGTWKIGMWGVDSGSTHNHHHTNGMNWVTVTGGAADTNATFDFTGTIGLAASGSGGSNAITAGQWIDFQIASDTDVTSSNAEFWFTLFFIADLASTI